MQMLVIYTTGLVLIWTAMGMDSLWRRYSAKRRDPWSHKAGL